MKKIATIACSLVMTATAGILWYLAGFTGWTIVAGALLLACPMLAIVGALREAKRTRERIEGAVQEELRRRTQ